MTVFMLGAGVMQMPALAIARELGWRVVAADGNPEAPGAGLCDRFVAVDLKDRVGLFAAVRNLGVDAVFTAGTDFSANVAWLADRLGLPGHRPEAALAASDKLLMRSRFDAAGLPSPRFVECAGVAAGLAAIGAVAQPTAGGAAGAQPTPAGAAGAQPTAGGAAGAQSTAGGAAVGTWAAAAGPPRLGFPLVVKPADNMGARGCRLALNEADLERALEAALPLSRSGRAIIEEYIDGPEFSVDALVYDGRIEIRGFADRHIAFSPYFVELGHTLPSAIEAHIRDEVISTFEAGVRSLGLSQGAAKGDMKWSAAKGHPMIGEIAARLSGGYMSGWTYPYASGIDLTRDALLLAAGLRPEKGRVDRQWHSAERAFISIPGRVARIEGLREARNSPFIKDLFLRTEPGAGVVFPSNNVEKCGNLISQAPDREGAVRGAEEAVRSILIRLEAPNEATSSFLRGEGRESGFGGAHWPPPAFALDADLVAALHALPEGSLHPIDPEAAISVLAFPPAESLGLRDWSGRSLADSARLALERGGGYFAPAALSPILGRAFWEALVVGGVQAAIYVLDCLRKGVALP